MEFGIGFIISAFIAGLFTFFTPCTLPLIPAFLAIIAGVRSDDLSHPERLHELRGKIFFNALWYVLGFSLVFILFGTVFSLAGKILVLRGLLEKIGGVLIMVFGLFMAGWLKISWLNADRKIHIPALFRTSGKINSFLIGALFALGWTPCVGPLVGTILLLASRSGTLTQGAFLLAVYSFGLAVPFLVTALLIGRAFTAFGRWGKALSIINTLGGIFLIIIGILLITGQFGASFASLHGLFYTFPAFQEFINRFM